MRANVRAVLALVMGCFFVSGAAGLVYQIAWARYLSLFLGHASYAVVAVLVAFMGGLAIGNALLGAFADRAEKPLALYGWLEIGVALYALAFPWYFEFCHDLYISAARHFPWGGTSLLLLKFLFSFLTIVLPTTLMGATFPALARFVTQSLAELRERVAALYFINSLGAVAGCLAADFWWIPEWGLEMTIFAAAGLNLAAGLVALAMSRAIVEGTPTAARASSRATRADDEYFSALDLKIATIAIGCSGFVAMLYEVAWTRLLALALGSSTHAFSIMLITFITGIAAGAALIARWKSLKRTMEAFGWAETILAATVFVSLFTYEALPFWFARMATLLARRAEAYPLYEFAQGLICFGVMFIPALCLGTTLPLASRIATAELSRTGRSVGRIFAVNTLGTVLGAAVTGLWLMPLFGLAGTFAIGFVLNAAIGTLILKRHYLPRARGPMIAAVVAVAVAGVVGATSHFDPLWRAAFTQGVWRARTYTNDFKTFRAVGRTFGFLYYNDGPGSTVALHTTGPNTNFVSLRVNGKTDASSGDVGTQLLLGHLPVLLHTKATNALVIGLGSGMTCGSLLLHTNILKTHAVEISPQIAEAARLLSRINNRVFENPRFELSVEDAKTFLQCADEKFDIIVSEPSNPWMAGVAAVFSREFYESCRAHLNQGGIMIQWVQVYETTDDTLRTVIKTLAASFPFISVWNCGSGDLILTGSTERRAVDLNALAARMTDPRIHADLVRGQFSEPLALLSREILSQENGAFLARRENVVHSDYYPTLEYMAQVGFFLGGESTLIDRHDETLTRRSTTLLATYLQDHPLSEADFRRVSNAILDGQFLDQRLTLSLMQRWADNTTNSTLPLEMMERIPVARPNAVTEEFRLAPRHAWLMEQARTDIASLQFYERVLMRSYRVRRTIFYQPDTRRLEEVLTRLRERDPTNRRVYILHQAELAWDRGDDESCLRLAAEGLSPDVKKGGPLHFTLDEQAPSQILCDLIDTELRHGRIAEAQNLAGQARARGFLRPGELFFEPLDFVCRKADTLAEGASSIGGAK